MKKIGLFGGSFDPIHFGHLNFAIEILEKSKIDEILFCPANISPHKVKNPPVASSKNRLEMVKRAIKGIDKFSLFDEEITRGNVSYTIDTLKALKKKYSENTEINLIIDQDLIKNFSKWKDYKDIFKMVNIIIGCRSDFILSNLPECFVKIPNKKMIITRHFEICSTMIRKRLASGFFCGYLVPAKVLDYIYKHSLY